MILSPLAAPFHPTFEPVNLAIYNDGVPTLAVPDEAERELLHGIQDDALDEGFPPDAMDAAELEAVETFVDILATLSLMEDRELAAREGFVGLAKRWKARREDGLLHRPRPAKHSVHVIDHQRGKALNSINITDLVSYTPNCPKSIMSLCSRQQQNEKHMSKASMKAGKNLGSSQRKPLQQPRKHY